MRLKSIFVLLLISFSSVAFAADHGKYFDRAIIVIFENTEYRLAIEQPFFKQLATEGAGFDNFFAISRPSQPNYIALTSGTTNGVRTNNNVDLDLTNIVDQLEAKGLSWRVYAEDYPENCFTGAFSRGYARKHNPFISYLNIQQNPSRCANIVNANKFAQDVSRGSLPNFVFYVPNNRNSAHDTNIAFADRWYKQAFGPLASDASFMKDTVLISTFDEGSFVRTRNQIYTSIYGPAVKPGNYSDRLTLFSLLKLLQNNWDLGSLGREDATAADIPNIWR